MAKKKQNAEGVENEIQENADVEAPKKVKKVKVILREHFSHVFDGVRIVGDPERPVVEIDADELVGNEHKFEFADGK